MKSSTGAVGPFDKALSVLDTIEANLERLERLEKEMFEALPRGIDFSPQPEYESRRRDFETIFATLPAIEGWKPDAGTLSSRDIAAYRLDAAEIDEPEAHISISEMLDEPRAALEEYRYRLNRKRREVVRKAVAAAEDAFSRHLEALVQQFEGEVEGTRISGEEWDSLVLQARVIDSLLGSVERPSCWDNLQRHLSFAMVGDLRDIASKDWPQLKIALSRLLLSPNEPIPVGVTDISELTDIDASGPVPVQLQWAKLDAEGFERLLFALVANSESYENVDWLMKTNAADRGRDLSAIRVIRDPLLGVVRNRVIFQCKHWLERSVNSADVATLVSQVRLWEPPRVDVLVIATSGRFTQDAVATIERQNNADRAMRIEMWPESHLERVLARRPGVVAEFGLR